MKPKTIDFSNIVYDLCKHNKDIICMKLHDQIEIHNSLITSMNIKFFEQENLIITCSSLTELFLKRHFKKIL